jgi:hypothetical protein
LNIWRNQMPLLEGNSQDVIDINIKELKSSGMPDHQATCVALKKANKAKAAERAVQGVKARPREKVKVK